MSLFAIVMSGITEIRYHKLRSFLTLIGILLGTGMIIFMTSMLNGIIVSVWDGFEELGYDGVLFVVSRPPKDLVERARFGQSRGLQPRDVELLRKRADLVRAVAPVQYGQRLIARGDVRRRVRVVGVTPEYAPLRRRQVAMGRFFNENDLASFRRVCILGHRLRLRLFGTVDPLGREVRIDRVRFRVVGVGKKLGNQYVNDSDFIRDMEGALIPLTTQRKFFTGDDAPLSSIAVKTRAVKQLGRVQAEIEASIAASHHGVRDFRIQNIAQEMVKSRDRVEGIVFNWQVVLGTIASVALLVGGLGLLSVMIISINERLYEIGMRKAIGATDGEIFLMFLVESVTLALLGALLGVGLGLIAVKALEGAFPTGLPVDWIGVAWAIGVAVSLGLVFGVYPALKASRMAPVEAMRGT
ncbi:MAG: ABC transporter permease [Acidobacteriota bacterium]